MKKKFNLRSSSRKLYSHLDVSFETNYHQQRFLLDVCTVIILLLLCFTICLVWQFSDEVSHIRDNGGLEVHYGARVKASKQLLNTLFYSFFMFIYPVFYILIFITFYCIHAIFIIQVISFLQLM